MHYIDRGENLGLFTQLSFETPSVQDMVASILPIDQRIFSSLSYTKLPTIFICIATVFIVQIFPVMSTYNY